MRPVIKVAHVTKCFDDETVIKDVDLWAAEGSIHAVVGPNGAGKSTFLKMTAGMRSVAGFWWTPSHCP